MATEKQETKAILIAQGEGHEFEPIKAKSIVKETFEERKYKRDRSSSNPGAPFLGNAIENDVMVISGQKIYAIAFEDGSVYVTKKGFIPTNEKEYLDKVAASYVKPGKVKTVKAENTEEGK